MAVVYIKDFDNGIFIYKGVEYRINSYVNCTRKKMERRVRTVLHLKGKHIEWKWDPLMVADKVVKIDYPSRW